MRIILALAVFLMLSSVSIILPMESQSNPSIQVGDPLHLYLRRMPVQDMTYLFFHPPDIDGYDERSGDNTTYRKILMQKGLPGDNFIMWYPQDPDSNFLQFEPNKTLEFLYNFTISAAYPGIPGPLIEPEINFTIDVLIEIDYQNDKKYDREIKFTIRDKSYSKPVKYEGKISIDFDSLKRFDKDNGGRIKMTLSRKDDLDTIVTIYCGYRGYHSHIQFPYSKYRYISENESSHSKTWIWVMTSGGVIIICAIIYINYKEKQQSNKLPSKKSLSFKKRR